MGNNRLLEAFTQFHPEEAERLFNGEAALRPPDPRIELAPIKRVAIFAEAFLPKVDGVSKTAYLTLRYLKQTGREVIVFAPDIAPSYVADTPVIALPSLGMSAAPETRIALPHPMVAYHLNQFKPDLIHLFSPALLSVSGMLVGRQNRIPVIANYQTDVPAYAQAYGYHFMVDLSRNWLRYIHNGCHLTLAPSHWTMRQLREWGYHRLRRWARGVDSNRFNPKRRSETMRAKLLNGRDPNSLVCIYVGRIANEKRVELLLEVAKTPGVALTIIGDGARREELETVFEGTGTHFTGYMFGDELADAYASADVFMFTSGTETFGQVVQEAMASGLPAVIINQGGIVDLVKHGETGYICPDDPAAFAQAAIHLRDNPGLRRCMSMNARRAAEAVPWETIMSELEGHYREAVLLNNRHNRLHAPPAPPRIVQNLIQRGQEWFGGFAHGR